MKKLLLGLGTIAAIVTPVASVVACVTTKNPILPKGDEKLFINKGEAFKSVRIMFKYKATTNSVGNISDNGVENNMVWNFTWSELVNPTFMGYFIKRLSNLESEWMEVNKVEYRPDPSFPCGYRVSGFKIDVIYDDTNVESKTIPAFVEYIKGIDNL